MLKISVIVHPAGSEKVYSTGINPGPMLEGLKIPFGVEGPHIPPAGLATN